MRGEVQLDGESAGRRAMPEHDVAAPKSGRPSKKVAEVRATNAARLADLELDSEDAA